MSHCFLSRNVTHQCLISRKYKLGKGHWIENQPLLREIYKEPPFISYRKEKSLKDILVRAKSKGQGTTPSREVGIVFGLSTSLFISMIHSPSFRSWLWFVSSACDFYLFPVILGHPRWPISKMALVGPSLLTVEVKSSDPRDSANDQKSLPRADSLRQIPRLCPDFCTVFGEANI